MGKIEHCAVIKYLTIQQKSVQTILAGRLRLMGIFVLEELCFTTYIAFYGQLFAVLVTTKQWKKLQSKVPG